VNNTFTWDLYSTNGTFLGANRESVSETTTGTFTADGWNSTSVDWTVASGTYWLALQVSSKAQTPGLDLPVESSTTSGTAPAIAFATAGSNARYALETLDPVGIEVTAVPLPAAVWLFGSALLGFGPLARRRRS
jgi:hypothetical protein